MILQFDLYDKENQRVWLGPQNVVSVHEYFLNNADPVSEIKMNNGDKHEVVGHVGEAINHAQAELEKEPWQRG